MIYFIKSPDGPIKIGTTIRLSRRLKQLASDCGQPLEVLAVVDGSFETERELHRQFSHLRVVDEWFEPGDDLVGFIVSEGRPWDGQDEAPPLRNFAMIRAYDLFAEQVKRASGERGMTAADFCEEFLTPCVDKAHREYIAAESRKLAEPTKEGRKGAK